MILVTAEEMRALDRRTIESGHAAGETLMERAGLGVAQAIERHFGTPLALHVLVLCGSGNNGGDGFVATRHLKLRGADVHVGLLCAPERVHGDARLHLDRLMAFGVTAARADTPEALASLIERHASWDLALDALLGTGARGVPQGMIAEGVRALRRLSGVCRVVAVDIPTGVDADTGAAELAVEADLTVTFGAPKRGHVLHPGRALRGVLEIVDIGLLPPSSRSDSRPLELAEACTLGALLPRRDPRAHKGAGRVLAIGGAPGLTGAMTLACRAATRAGAGYVQAAVPKSLNDILEVKLTEEMTIPCEETPARALALAAWDAIHAATEHVDCVALGSGMSRDHESAKLARRVALEHASTLVLDADGLNAFEGHAADLARARGSLVLTPHLGEMARLTGVRPSEIEARRIDAAREWAVAWRVVLVVKGAPTVTAAPSGEATVNDTGNPGMATAGMGDVLTGIIASLAAQGLSAYNAARVGVFLHGLAADRVAARRGAIGMRAGDVIPMLPSARRWMARAAETPLEPR